MWNKYKSWFEGFDKCCFFKILPTSENCLSLDKWKKSSPPLTYLQKCKLENTLILDIERNLLHNKAQPVRGGERVFEALRDFFWRPTRKQCDGLIILWWISFWYSEVYGWCCCWITYYEERMSGALKDSVLCHRVLHLVLLYDHLRSNVIILIKKL